MSHPTPNVSQPVAEPAKAYSKEIELVRTAAQSPWPAWGLSALFFSTAPLHPARYPHLPPFIHRFGFGLILAGAGYMVNQDKLNGSGVATAWSLSYLFFHLRSSLRTRSPVALGLSGATALCAGLYGSEYFLFQEKPESEETTRRRPPTTFAL